MSDLNPQPLPPDPPPEQRAQQPAPPYGQQPAGQPAYGQQPAGQPAYGQQQPYGQAPGYNTMAIVAFVLAFFFSVVGVILGFVALSQIKRTGEQGRGFAIAGIVIGFAEIVIGIIVGIVVAIALGVAATQYQYSP